MKLILLILRPKLLLILLLILAVVGVYWFKFGSDGAPAGYKLEKSYNKIMPGRLTCASLSPECGYCPGKVINDKCYVLKDNPLES